MYFRKGYVPLILLLIVFIIGCSKLSSKIEDDQFTPAKTDIVSNHDGIENITRLKEFIQNVSKEKEDKIRVVSFTKEGDPIINDITFDLETLEVSSDRTRDKYGEKAIKTHSCKTIEVNKNEQNQDEYVLTRCSGYDIPFYLGVD